MIKINDDGTLMVKGLGSCWIYTTYQSRVMFRNGVAGVVSSRVRPEKVENQMVNLFVDLGVSTKQEAEQLVEIGDVAVFLGDYLELAGSCVTAKAIDDRVGCYMQMQALMELEAPKNDVYLAFTVQEEVGTRGGGVVAHQVRPDVGVAVDVTPAHDRPGDLEGSSALGKGVAIKTVSYTHLDVYKRQVVADFLDETAVAGEAGIRNYNAVEGRFLSAHSSQSDFYCHVFVLQFSNQINFIMI